MYLRKWIIATFTGLTVLAISSCALSNNSQSTASSNEEVSPKVSFAVTDSMQTKCYDGEGDVMSE